MKNVVSTPIHERRKGERTESIHITFSTGFEHAAGRGKDRRENAPGSREAEARGVGGCRRLETTTRIGRRQRGGSEAW